jgi:hypothetical protein
MTFGLRLTLLAVATSAAGAQDSARLTVQATTGADARPVAGAVIVIDSVPVPNGRTDEQGRWAGSIAAGPRHLRILSIGFRPRDTVVVLGPSGATVRMDMRETMVPLGEVIVTAARREQRLADAVVETELITARDLARGPADVASVLAERTGIQISSPSAQAYRSTAACRPAPGFSCVASDHDACSFCWMASRWWAVSTERSTSGGSPSQRSSASKS